MKITGFQQFDSRLGSNVYFVGGYDYYWSSTAIDSYYAYDVYGSDYVYPGNDDPRYYGCSVRLITECQ